jgi:L-alanine-DL-glutamate epimerase-like enolase superfamily enzyme
MKITSVTTFLLPRGSVFVKVDTDEGIAGWGECSPMNGPVIQAMVAHAVAPQVVGGDPFAVEVLGERMLRRPYKLGPQGALPEAIAGVDIALWDVVGKATGQPIWRLLGGSFRDRVPVYFSYGWGGRAVSPDQVVAELMARVEQGYRTLKLRMNYGPLMGEIADDPALPLLRAIRRAVGDEVRLAFDVNNGYTAHKAIQIGRVLQDELDIAWYEEPTPQYDYQALAQAADALDLPVSAGEHEYTRWQFRDLLLQGRPDILQPDLVKCCGFTEARKIAALCEAWGKPIVVHNTQPTIGTAASLHFCAASANAFYTQEYTGPREDLRPLFKNELEFVDGELIVPQGPGLGLEVDEAQVRAAALAGL